jgi:hypothetical protein
MENLKSGDVPALVTNIELLSILSEKISVRKEKEALDEVEGQPTRGKNKRLQHRDFIEESVKDYLQSSACAYADKNEMPNFICELRNGTETSIGVEESEAGKVDSTRLGSVDTQVDDNRGKQEEIEGVSKYEHDYDDESIGSNDGTRDEETAYVPIASSSIIPPERDVAPGGFGLTDAETLQILNLMPKEPVEIHLMIEDLQSRFGEDRQQELLNIIAKYSGYNDHVESENADESEEFSQNYDDNPVDSYR